MNLSFRELAQLYQTTLLQDVIPFWQQHAVDASQGGYFSCLDRDGVIYDTDKFVWLQNRQLWTFSMLYNQVEPRPDWLTVATVGAEFLARHGRDSEGSWYFALTRDGRPLVQPYNLFSDCFAAMAFSQYAKASGESWAKEIAQQAYENVLRRQDNPKGKYSKAYPGTRPMKSLAGPMILANLSLEMDWLLERDRSSAILDQTVHTVMTDFRDSVTGLMYENIAPDGSHLDSFDGRLLNPGHGIEAMWFIMDIAQRRQQEPLIYQAVDTMLAILDYAWDREFGGLYYFLDAQGHPPDKLEWDQKLWWVHLETLVALVMAYRLTGRQLCWDWYQTVHDYAWSHFADPGREWFGYLDRRGQVLLPLKGGKWKGCFHVPRAMYLCWHEFEMLSEAG